MSTPTWRSWPKVSHPRQGQANTKRYRWDEPDPPRRKVRSDVDALCSWCGRPATRMCDYIVGRVGGGDTLGDDDWQRMATCDSPVCDACGTVIGHMCGDEPDTIDACPRHAGSGLGSILRRVVGVEAWRARMAIASRNSKALALRMPALPPLDRGSGHGG